MMTSSFVRVPHLAIDDSALTAHALSVLVALANTPPAEGSDGWVRISVAAFAARCGWAADSDCATRRRVSRALANALEQGFVERRWVTRSKYRAPEYRLTQRWTEAMGFEPLPRCHLERLTLMGSELLRHWLVLRRLAGAAGHTAVPLGVECRLLGVRSATASRQRHLLHQAGLVRLHQRIGDTTVVWLRAGDLGEYTAAAVDSADVGVPAGDSPARTGEAGLPLDGAQNLSDPAPGAVDDGAVDDAGTPDSGVYNPPTLVSTTPPTQVSPSIRHTSSRQTFRRPGASEASTAPRLRGGFAAASQATPATTRTHHSQPARGDAAAKAAADIVTSNRLLATASPQMRGMVRQRLAWWLRRLPTVTALGVTRTVVAERLRCQVTLDEHYIRHVDETIRGLWADLKAAPDQGTSTTTRVTSQAAEASAPPPRPETLDDLAHGTTDAATDMGRWVASRIAAQILAAPDRDQHHVLDVAHRWWRKNLTRTRGLDYAGLAYATAVVERAISASGAHTAPAGPADDLELDAAAVSW